MADDDERGKWSWARMKWNKPVDKGPKEFTKVGTQPESPDDPDWRGIIKNKVIEYPVPEAYKFGQPVDHKYFWFDTPDYADPFKKLWYSSKFFCYTGLFGLCARGIMESRRFTFANNADLSKKILIPWLIGGVAASATVILVANLRGKKDDYYNYAIAGAVLGSILGRENHVKWFRWMCLSVPAAIIVKHNAEINGFLLPAINWRRIRYSLSGNDTEHGVASGDLRFGFRGNHDDPGRDLRKTY